MHPLMTICRRCGGRTTVAYAEKRSGGLCVMCFTGMGAPVIDPPPPALQFIPFHAPIKIGDTTVTAISVSVHGLELHCSTPCKRCARIVDWIKVVMRPDDAVPPSLCVRHLPPMPEP